MEPLEWGVILSGAVTAGKWIWSVIKTPAKAVLERAAVYAALCAFAVWVLPYVISWGAPILVRVVADTAPWLLRLVAPLWELLFLLLPDPNSQFCVLGFQFCHMLGHWFPFGVLRSFVMFFLYVQLTLITWRLAVFTLDLISKAYSGLKRL